MKKVKTILVVLFIGIALKSSAFGGVATISPDGNTIAYSAGNYALYLLDAKTFEVQKRMRLEKNPDQSFNFIYNFSPDGKTFLFSAGWDIFILNTSDWQVKRKIKKEGDVYMSDDHSSFMIYDDKKITIYNSNTGNITNTIMTEVDADDIQNVIFSADNSKLIVLSEQVDSETEEDKKYGYKDFDGLSDKEELEKDQKNDGKDMTYTIIDIVTAKVEKTKTIWFSDRSMEMVSLPNNAFILGNRDGIVKVDANDVITVYDVEGGESYCYDEVNNLIVYTTSFGGVNVFNFEFVNEFDLKNKHVSFSNDCFVHNGMYYIMFNEFCIASCSKGGVNVSPTPIY